jgi:CDP-glycerol glycerophosphotransferase
MFDYSLLKRPMLFYCYDLEEYRDNLRGFYFDFLSEAPGPVVLTTEDLIMAITQYDTSAYREKQEAFYQKYNHADDGNASRKITELLQQMEV